MFILSFDGKGEFSAANIPVDLVIKKHLKIKIYVETMIFIFFRIVLMNQSSQAQNLFEIEICCNTVNE